MISCRTWAKPKSPTTHIKLIFPNLVYGQSSRLQFCHQISSGLTLDAGACNQYIMDISAELL